MIPTGAAPADVARAGIGRRPGWTAWRFVLLAWLGSRVAYLLIAGIAAGLRVARPDRDGLASWLWPFRAYLGFDTGYFRAVAEVGYVGSDGHVTMRAAFFPGYPAVTRAVADLLGVGNPGKATYIAAAAVAAWLAALVAGRLLWRIGDDLGGRPVAAWSVVVWFFGPYSVFVMASYSEGLFMALACAAWLCCIRDRWAWGWTFAALASLVRINGSFLAVGLAVLALWPEEPSTLARRLARAGGIAVPALATLGYFGYLWTFSGSLFTWFDVERQGWGRHLTAPWTTLARSVTRAPHGRDFGTTFQNYMELLFLALMIGVAIWCGWRRNWAWTVFVGLTALSLGTSTFLLSVPRSTLTLFPVICAMGYWAARERRRWLVAVAVVAGGAIAIINALTFTAGVWTG